MNARSLISKLNDLEILVDERDPDLIFICETWLNNNICNSTLNIEGYNLEQELRIDRTDTVNGIGGGILVYSKPGIIIKPITTTIDFVQYSQFELISLNGKEKSNQHFTLIYRSPNSTETNNEKLCEIMKMVPKNSILVGDFNMPGIDWKNGTYDRKSTTFMDTMYNKGLEQMIDFPTHDRGNTLDLLITDHPENIVTVESLGNLGNSDHSIIHVELLFNPKIVDNETMVFDWRNCNETGLKNYFNNIDWSESLLGKDVENQWKEFQKVVDTGLQQYVPMKKRCKLNKCVWMTKKVKNLINYKNRIFKLVKHNRTEENVRNSK